LRCRVETPSELPLDLSALHQDAMAAALADEADVRTKTDHLPGSAATGM
jgi:hypothetical protein